MEPFTDNSAITPGFAPPVGAETEQSIDLVADWSPQEEQKAKRKLDLLAMPTLTLGYFCLQLDRGNIANALTDNFLEDIGINQNQFNIGQQLLFIGIFLFEIPSNMILYRVGPGKWLTLQLFLFGSISTFQAFQNNYASFLTTRFLLGIAESGFIPGGLWTVSTWYTKKETAKRIMFFYFGNQFGQASSKLLAYGILHMRGVGGKPGWFWLFALMGDFTVLSGVILGLFLPDSFQNPHSTFLYRKSFFTERELHILQTRVYIDDPMKGKKKEHIGREAFKKAVKYFGVVWTQIFGTFSHPLNIAWMALVCHDSEERALAMAMAIMGGNIAGVYGAQIFRKEDSPLYRRGFSTNIAIIAVGLALGGIRYIDDTLRGRQWRMGSLGRLGRKPKI